MDTNLSSPRAVSMPPPPPPPPPPAFDFSAPVGEIGLMPLDQVKTRKKVEMPDWLSYFRSRAITLSVGMAVILALVAYLGLKPSESLTTEDVFAPLTGYTYSTLPDEQLEGAREMMKQVPFASDYIKDFEVRSVLKKGAQAAMAIAIMVEPSELATMDRSAMSSGFQASAGGALKTVKIKGMDAYQADVLGARVVLFIDPAGAIVEVLGTDKKSVKKVAKQLATAAAARASS